VVTRVLQRDVPVYGEFVGETEAANQVEIRSQVSGFLQEIAFQEGALVPIGQLLFQIDPRQYAAAVEQARAVLKQREAALMKVRQDVRRYRLLGQQDVIPRQQLDTAVAQEAQERANVEAAKAQLAQALLNLSYTRITAPLTGRIGAAQVKIGALVQAGATLLDTMYSVDPVYVTFNVSERDYLEYQKRTRERPEVLPPLYIILADGSTYPHAGRINMVSPQVNRATGTIAVRGEFPNPEELLKPGLFVRVRLQVEERKNALVVPQQAIQEVQGVKSVLVVGDDQKVALRTVTASTTMQDFAVIDSGLRPGERVIVEGAQKVRPGVPVVAEERPLEALARLPQQPQPGQDAGQKQQPSPPAGRAPPASPR
jgi:membrane fusion protein (multidrug efflux system)